MQNKILVAVVGIFAAFTALASDFAETEAIDISRQSRQSSITVTSASRKTKYDGYTVDEYIASYKNYKSPNKKILSQKVLLDVPIVNQYPELPCGCEIASAVAVMHYLGLKIPLTTFADKYITYDTNFYHDDADVLWGPDPAKVFVGDPFGWGYGCYPKVLAADMNTYFTAEKSKLTAHPVSGLTEDDLEDLVDGGVPVIVWATLDMENFDYKDPSVWNITGTKIQFTWYKNSHTLVLCGYDDDAFYFMDPNDKDEIVAYGRDLFMTRYNQAGKKAVIIKR